MTTAAAGLQLGGGFDVQITRSFMMGARAGYNFVSDFATPLDGEDNFSGFEIGIEFGWVFGRGRNPQ